MSRLSDYKDDFFVSPANLWQSWFWLVVSVVLSAVLAEVIMPDYTAEHSQPLAVVEIGLIIAFIILIYKRIEMCPTSRILSRFFFYLGTLILLLWAQDSGEVDFPKLSISALATTLIVSFGFDHLLKNGGYGPTELKSCTLMTEVRGIIHEGLILENGMKYVPEENGYRMRVVYWIRDTGYEDKFEKKVTSGILLLPEGCFGLEYWMQKRTAEFEQKGFVEASFRRDGCGEIYNVLIFHPDHLMAVKRKKSS